jgi:hypothetical protein
MSVSSMDDSLKSNASDVDLSLEADLTKGM